MTGRERILKALECGEPDRVPIFELAKTVSDTIQAAAPGGAYIMSSSNTIHPGVKAENYIAMVRATKRYGRYPIEVPSST